MAGTHSGSTSYTIGQLSKMADVSTRTLRHYEDVGLLNPKRTASGYRVYSASDATRLAHVLALRSCEIPLSTIRRLLDDPDVDLLAALVAHLSALRMQGKSLDEAVRRTENAIAAIERIKGMDVKTSFEELKAQGLAQFEDTYGKEARALYGDEAIDKANERMMGLTRDEWDAKELLEESIKVQLRLAMATGDATSDESAELARMHERWIRVHWGDGYTREAHLGLAHGYLEDERFKSYYDGAAGFGATEFLVSVLESHL